MYPSAPILRPPPTSPWAIASLTLSIVGLVTAFCLFGAPSLLAVICGHAALSHTKDGQRSGRGMAAAGLTLGYIVVVPVAILAILAGLGHGLTALGA